LASGWCAMATRLTGDSGATYVVDGPPVGAGGQAVVHAATCEDDGARVAVRVARGPGPLALHLRRQAERQRQLLAGPVGRWVLPVWDEGTWDDRPFVVTSWAPRALGDGPVDRVVLRALVAAVEACGAAGEVHGDLTPGNVLLPDGGGIWLADHAVGDGWFTPGYAPPEQVLGRPRTPEVDRYALAATLWTVLAGAPPGGPARVAGALRAAAREAPDARGWPLPRAFDLGACALDDEDRRRFDARCPTDGAIRDALSAHLEPDPARRPRDLRGLADALDGRPPAERRRSGLRWTAGAGAVGLAALAVAAGRPGPCPPGFAGDGRRCVHPDGRVVLRVGPQVVALGTDRPDVRDAPPRFAVLTRAFFLDRTEVTQGAWAAVTGERPMAWRDQILDDGVRAPCFHWRGHLLLGDDLPVACVSFVDAARYANRRSLLDGLPPAYEIAGDEVRWDRSSPGWRLPTEAEWEAAAAAGTALRHGAVCAVANTRDRSAPAHWGGEATCDDRAPGLAPVGSYPENERGFVDLYGNVAEWTWDRYAAPAAGSWGLDPVGPPDGPMRTFRGGSWMHVARGVRVRWGAAPAARDFALGLRRARYAD
jgi:sulfatase modifying factor 1